MNEQGALGVLMNKAGITLLELRFRHRLVSLEDSGQEWRLEVEEPGKLVARFVDGHQQGIDLAPGDFVLSTPSELYVSLQASPGAAPEEGPAPARRPARRRRAPASEEEQ